LEGLDDDHASAAARTRRSRLRWFDRFRRLGYRRHREQRTGAGDIGLAAGGQEQAIVPNAVKALRQYVQQEAPDEFVCGERHRAIARSPVAAIILVPEGDAAFVERDQQAVRDGDTVRVARQIGEHHLWPGKGWPGVDHPVLLPQPCGKAPEGAFLVQPGMIAEEGEPARGMKLKESYQ
jgi:hypothetical protein